jgi:hypothetical protein
MRSPIVLVNKSTQKIHLREGTAYNPDLRDLMSAAPNYQGMTIVDVLHSSAFLEPNLHLQKLRREYEEQLFFMANP